MLLRRLYYWKKLRDFDGSPPPEVRQQMLQTVIEAAAETEAYDITPDTELEAVSVLSDEALRRMLHDQKTERDVPYFTTSGTTGTVRVAEIDESGYDWMCAYTLELYTQLGWRPGDHVLAAPRNEPGRSWIGRQVMPITAGELEDHEQLVDQINELEPAVVKSYPRVLVAAVRNGSEIEHQPTAIIVTGELLTPTMRQELEDAFDATVLDFYGTAEVGRMAIDDDGTGFELLDCMTETELPADDIGRPIASTLVNVRNPVLRYRLPDLVEVGDHEDGFARLLGRTRHIIEQDGETIYPADLVERIYQHPEIIEFTIHEGEEADLRIEVVARDGTDPKEQLSELLQPLDLSVATTVVDGPLPVTEGGKKRTFARSFGQ